MSTKTLLKRLAFGTAVAVAAGTISLVSTTSAHAALSGNTTSYDGDIASLAGTGLVGALSGTSNTSLTATLLSTGSLVVATNSGSHLGVYVVSAGAYVAAAGGAGAITAGQNQFTPAANSETFTVAATGAAGSVFTITGYTTSAKTTVESVLTVTIAGTSAYGVPSAAKTTVAWVPVNTGGTVDAAGASQATNSTNGTPAKLYLQVNLADAYGNPVNASAGALTFTASTGANIGTNSGVDSPATAGSYSVAVNTGAYSKVNATISEATAGAGWSGTVTVAFNGTVLATKAGIIQGYVAKIVIAANQVAKSNTSTASALTYNAYDAAGNVDTVTTVATASSSNTASVVSSGSITVSTPNNATNSGELGYLSVTALAAGKSTVAVSYTRPDGTVITSNAASINVGGNSDSYKVSLDKSSYAPGDIATMKITFLDSKGNPAASSGTTYATAGSTPAYTWNATFSTPQMTQIGSLGSFGSSFVNTYGSTGNIALDANGQITIKYTVGTTEGSFNAVVDFPTIDGQDGAAQTVAYKVSAGATTSLNDVLKGIVSLIASINKQIAALAKLVTKK